MAHPVGEAHQGVRRGTGRLLDDQGGRGLAEKAAAGAMAGFQDLALGNLQIDRDAVAAKRIVEGHGLVRLLQALAHAPRLRSRNQFLVIELVAHLNLFSASSSPASRASISASLL